jgi:tight adherence protein C
MEGGTFGFLRDAMIATFALAAFVLSYTVAAAPSRAASRLGMRGLKRRRALENNAAWAQIEPLARWLGVRVSGLPSEETYRKIDALLTRAGDHLGVTPEEFLGLSILSFAGGIVFGLVIGQLTELGPILAFLGGPLGLVWPYFLIDEHAQIRLKQINHRLPYVIDLMALAMSAGLDFPGAVRQVVEKSSDAEDALTEEFTRLLQEIAVGRTRKQALLEFARRAPIDAVGEFVGALVQAEERGNPVAEVLQIQAVVSRQRRTVNAEEAAAKAGVQMVGPLFLLFGCIMLLVLAPMILSFMRTKY